MCQQSQEQQGGNLHTHARTPLIGSFCLHTHCITTLRPDTRTLPNNNCRYYYYHNSGLQQQYVLFGQDSLQAEAVCLLDPNTLSEDGTVALKVRRRTESRLCTLCCA